MMDVESGPGFPATHTTKTTTTSTSVITSLRLDPSYVRGLPGTLKCAQMVLDLVGFICVAVAVRPGSTVNWFSFVAMGGFWITLVLLLFFLYHVIEKFYSVPWLLVEWIYCALWAFFYFSAATAAAVQGKYDSALAAAAFFGYAAMLVYGFDAVLKCIAWRAGELAQGERITKTASTSSPSPRSPAY